MKLLTRLKYACAAGSLCAALCTSATADVTTVKPEDASKHFAAVSKHLELGGPFFTYVDIDGDFASLAEVGDKLIDFARKQGTGINKDLSAGKIIEALGFNSIKALGLSSRGLGKDLYHNRALIYMPGGPKGLMKLFGGKAAPYRITSFAPGNSGLALQVELSLSALLETAEGVIKATGEESALSQYRMGLAFPVPGLNMNVGELVGKLNTRIMVAVRFEDGAKISVPGAPVEFPRTQIMIALDDVDFLMEPLLAMLGDNDNVSVEKGDGFTVIRPNASLPGGLDYFKPGLYHDKKSKRVILTSHVDLAKSAGTGDTLGSNADFKKAMEGLPAEGNGLTYVTPQFVKTFFDFYKDLIRQTASAGGSPRGMDELMNSMFELFPQPKVPVASIYANVPEGMLFMSNTGETHKQTIAQLAIMPVAFVAGVAAGYQSTMQRARASAERTERSIEESAPNGGGSAKAVKSNLQQIAFSAQTYFIDNPKEKEVSYETLVKNELIFDLDPVAGESYKGLTLKRGGGELSVKVKGGDAITFKYQAAK
jgi:hypothetical protein